MRECGQARYEILARRVQNRLATDIVLHAWQANACQAFELRLIFVAQPVSSFVDESQAAAERSDGIAVSRPRFPSSHASAHDGTL